MTERRFIVGAAVAPLAVPVVLLALARTAQIDSGFKLVLGFGTLASYGSFALIGLPLVLLLQRLGRLTLPILVSAGTLAGIVVFYLVLEVFGALLASSPSFGALDLAWGAACGFAVALVFGLVAGITSGSSRSSSLRSAGG
jgi:hypothetical protein